MTAKKKKTRRKAILISTIALVLIGLSVAAFVRKREVVFTIQSEKATRRNLTEKVMANGRIQPVLQVKISPEVSGEIIELAVKEGQQVNKGDLLLRIRPDFYQANRNQAEASYKASLAALQTTEASAQKAELEFKRNEELFSRKLISDSVYLDFKTMNNMAKGQLQSAIHQVEMAKANLARASEELAKTTIASPLTATVSKLNSQLGERVVGTATMAGTEVMTLADLNEMEARVDIGEMDIVLIEVGQKATLEVDAFRDKKFSGVVTEIANSSKAAFPGGGGGGGGGQDATKFEVRIRIGEKAAFRPGMSVTSEIETRTRTNVVSVPIASVTTRMPNKPEKKGGQTNAPAASKTVTNSASEKKADEAAEEIAAAEKKEKEPATESKPTETNSTEVTKTEKDAKSEKKKDEPPKPIEVVFVVENGRAKMVPVKRGISDDSYVEITEGLKEGDEVVSGSYKVISRDLAEGKKVKVGPAAGAGGENNDKKKTS